MEERRVSVRNGMFETEVLEGGDGPPLLYLHGVAGVQAGDPFLQRLAETHRVIAPRLPGFGGSSGTEHLLDLYDLIYYELDLLDALQVRDLPIIGHSLGGMVAAELAAVQPERFSAVALIAPIGLWNVEYPVADFFSMAPDEIAAATYHDTDSPAAQSAARAPEENEAYIAFMVDRAKSLATAAKYLWPIPNRGLVRRLHRIAAPTLLIWGESDQIVPPRYAEDFRSGIPNAAIEILPETGHLPQVEAPERLAETVERFLAAR